LCDDHRMQEPTRDAKEKQSKRISADIFGLAKPSTLPMLLLEELTWTKVPPLGLRFWIALEKR
jgi:hypothetical protein